MVIDGYWWLMVINGYPQISGWWLTYPSEKSWSVSNSWDDDIPNIWKVIKFMFQTTKQQTDSQSVDDCPIRIY